MIGSCLGWGWHKDWYMGRIWNVDNRGDMRKYRENCGYSGKSVRSVLFVMLGLVFCLILCRIGGICGDSVAVGGGTGAHFGSQIGAYIGSGVGSQDGAAGGVYGEGTWADGLTPDADGMDVWGEYCRKMEEAARQVRVAVYSTHSSESYTASDGAAKLYGSRGGVYRASEVLAERLRLAGIGVVVDETIHDWPEWEKSYSNSLETAQKLLKKYTELAVLIDMHRDAGVSRENSIVEIDGRTAARVMLVVGSNQRYQHDNWRQNEAFSEEIADIMEEMYPGLLRRVSVQSGRYNQHISSRAILVEMGTTENTAEEVEYSAKLLANVLKRLLEESEGSGESEKSGESMDIRGNC